MLFSKMKLLVEGRPPERCKIFAAGTIESMEGGTAGRLLPSGSYLVSSIWKFVFRIDK